MKFLFLGNLTPDQVVYGKALFLANRELHVRRDPAAARRIVDEALATLPLEQLSPRERPYNSLALFYANLGEPDRAEGYLDAWYSHRPEGFVAEDLYTPPRVRGLIAAARGDYHTAVAELRVAEELDRACRICTDYDLGRVYAAAGMPDSAIAVFERYVETPYWGRLGLDDNYLPATLERLAQLHEAQGNAARAREYYLRFAALWADADPEFQPRVRAALGAVERVGGDGR